MHPHCVILEAKNIPAGLAGFNNTTYIYNVWDKSLGPIDYSVKSSQDLPHCKPGKTIETEVLIQSCHLILPHKNKQIHLLLAPGQIIYCSVL